MTNWHEPGFVQRYHAADFQFFTVTDSALDPQTGAWNSVSFSQSSSFSFLCVGSARKDVWCLAGLAPSSGDFVLERWQLKPKKFQASGGSSLPPGLISKRFATTGIYRGPLADSVVAVDFDPEGRFMMALVRNNGGPTILYRFDNQVNASPIVELDSSMIPELSQMTFMNRMQHATLGRVWIMRDSLNEDFSIALVDADNDGFFEGPPLDGHGAFWRTSGLDEYNMWDPLTGL